MESVVDPNDAPLAGVAVPDAEPAADVTTAAAPGSGLGWPSETSSADSLPSVTRREPGRSETGLGWPLADQDLRPPPESIESKGGDER